MTFRRQRPRLTRGPASVRQSKRDSTKRRIIAISLLERPQPGREHNMSNFVNLDDGCRGHSENSLVVPVVRFPYGLNVLRMKINENAQVVISSTGAEIPTCQRRCTYHLPFCRYLVTRYRPLRTPALITSLPSISSTGERLIPE
jgi:hypothetical protein